MQNAKLEITMLGEFTIKYGDNVISEKDDNSRKKWALLKYLIAFRNREVSQVELMEKFWGGTDNASSSALKTQLHRVRKTLIDKLGLPFRQEVILSHKGGYSFNHNLECTIDAEVFERLYNLSNQSEFEKTRRLKFSLQAIDVYKGGFLQANENEQWVVQMNMHYRNMFLKMVNVSIDILLMDNKLSEVIELCRRALEADEHDQRIHYMLIKAFSMSGDKHSAKRHYDYVHDLFHNKAGLSLSREITDLFEELIVTRAEYEPDINVIRKALRENSPAPGAFFVEYEIFKYIYRLLLRDCKRSKKSLHVCTITLSGKSGKGNRPQSPELAAVAESVSGSIGASLRANDIFARYGVYQYVICLLDSDGEMNREIMERILRTYKSEFPKSSTVLTYSIGENETANPQKV
jgi:DNA-binding SARP family transcriptional activator